jgi:hypothetical protein
MFTQIAFYPILNLPLIVWGGVFTLGLFILAAIVGVLNSKGITRPPLITYKVHILIATIGLIIGILHGILGLLAFI